MEKRCNKELQKFYDAIMEQKEKKILSDEEVTAIFNILRPLSIADKITALEALKYAYFARFIDKAKHKEVTKQRAIKIIKWYDNEFIKYLKDYKGDKK